MSNQFSSVWLEIKGPIQKILICTLYREFSDRNGQGRYSENEEKERWQIFREQVNRAAKEGLILCLGDYNIDLDKLDDTSYYLKYMAEEYQTLVGECGLETINFGITRIQIDKVNNVVEKSAIYFK